jgi:hypothetical protein
LAKRGGPHFPRNCRFYKRESTPGCTLGPCHPVDFTIFNLNETGWNLGEKFDILICEKETAPGTCFIANPF